MAKCEITVADLKALIEIDDLGQGEGVGPDLTDLITRVSYALIDNGEMSLTYAAVSLFHCSLEDLQERIWGEIRM